MITCAYIDRENCDIHLTLHVGLTSRFQATQFILILNDALNPMLHVIEQLITSYCQPHMHIHTGRDVGFLSLSQEFHPSCPSRILLNEKNTSGCTNVPFAHLYISPVPHQEKNAHSCEGVATGFA